MCPDQESERGQQEGQGDDECGGGEGGVAGGRPVPGAEDAGIDVGSDQIREPHDERVVEEQVEPVEAGRDREVQVPGWNDVAEPRAGHRAGHQAQP